MVDSDSVFLIVFNGKVKDTKVYVDGVQVAHALTKIDIVINPYNAKVSAQFTVMN